MKTISSINLKNKTVLLRADINSDFVNGKVLMSERIKESAKTINYLKKKRAKIVVIAHQGNPKGRYFTSLRQHSKLLNKFTKIKFVDDIIGRKAEKSIKDLKPGQAILLENIRFLKDEYSPKKKNNKLLKLTKLCDIYVNDSFSVCHREHASMVLLPKKMKSYAGPLLLKEVNALKKIKLKDCLYILGGGKPKDNLKLLKGKKALACGLFGQLCLIAKGKNLGAQNLYLKSDLPFVPKLKKKLKNVQTPVDFAVKVKGKRKELLLEDFPSKHEIYDIGRNTQDLYVKKIRKAKTIFMKGPAGFCPEKQFCNGTFAILKAITNNKKAFSVIGGGTLSNAIKKSKIPKSKFNHISLSGGALLRYIAGEKLPGLEVLK